MKNQFAYICLALSVMTSANAFAYSPNGGAPMVTPAHGEKPVSGWAYSGWEEAMSNAAININANGFQFQDCRELTRFTNGAYGDDTYHITYLCNR